VSGSLSISTTAPRLAKRLQALYPARILRSARGRSARKGSAIEPGRAHAPEPAARRGRESVKLLDAAALRVPEIDTSRGVLSSAREDLMSVVLVTGSSTGIGLATALHFGRLGDGVYAGVRDIATATELTKAIEAEKLPVHPITLDVDDQASVTRAVGEVFADTGRIDVQ
jgi:hypothetical protein